MPYQRPTLSELIARVGADIAGRLTGGANVLARSVLSVLARVIARGMADLYGYVDFVSRQILPDTAEAEYLARHARRWNILRKAPSPATGSVAATGVNGSVIPTGTVLVRVDGIRYATTAAALVAAGTATLSVEAEAAGTDGNCPAATPLTFASPIAGVQAIAAVGGPGLGGGAAEERDEELLDRLLLRMRTPPDGGAEADYRRWALEVPGVTRAWVYPLYLGAGTVALTFVMDGREDVIPIEADVELVQAHIDLVRPVLADVTVFAPIPVVIDFTIAVDPATPDVQAAIAAELADLFTRDSEPGGTMWLSRMVEAISLAAGEHHHRLLAPAADLAMGPGNMAILGDIQFEAID